MDGLRLHSIEHGSFLVKEFKELLGFWMVSRNNNCYVFFGSILFPLDLYGFEIIAFLLTSFIKPIREKSCTLSLLLTCCAAHVKQNIGIRVKESFNNTKHGLPNLLVVGRGSTAHVDKVEPICNKFRIIFQREIHKNTSNQNPSQKRNGQTLPKHDKR